MGIGNPSESGYHLLYYFRQENELPKTNFIHAHEIVSRSRGTLREPKVNRYIFIDDFSGSGTQGIDYSEEIVQEIKSLKKDAIVQYFVLFATDKAIDNLKRNTDFDDIKWIFKLDSSYSVFSENSRYYTNELNDLIDKDRTKDICKYYGRRLTPADPLGYKNCQLLIAFHHNTPDNTLPVFWYNSSEEFWFPIFPRYNKIYGD